MKKIGLNLGKKKINSLITNNKDIAGNDNVILKKHINIYDIQNNIEYMYTQIADMARTNINEFVNKKIMFIPSNIISVSGSFGLNGISVLDTKKGFTCSILSVNKYNEVSYIISDSVLDTTLNFYPIITITKTLPYAHVTNVDRYLLIIIQGNKLLALKFNKSQFEFQELIITNANYNQYNPQLIVRQSGITNAIFPEINYTTSFVPIVNFDGVDYINNFPVTDYIHNVPASIS